MSIIDILILFLIIIGIVGSGWSLIAGAIMIYGWIETKILRRRIPEKIKMEVQDARYKREGIKEDFRRKYAGTGNLETEKAFESARGGVINQQPERIQQVSIGGDIPDGRDAESVDAGNFETQRRSEPVRRKSGWRRI